MPRKPRVHLKSYETNEGTRYRLRWHTAGRDQWEQGYSEEQATERQAEIEAALRHHEVPLASRGTQKLRDYAEYHFRTALTTKGTPLRPRTLESYRQLVKQWIGEVIEYPDPTDLEGDPAKRRRKQICLGNLALKRITPELVSEWHYAVAYHNPDQAAKAYRCLSGIMSRAVREQQIRTHPCQKKGAGSEHRAERKVPAKDAPWRISQQLAQHHDAYGRTHWKRYAAIPMVIGYGAALRKSEMRGLQRGDVFPTEEKIQVARQAYFTTDGWDTEAPTKSEAGVRPVWIGKVAMGALVAHMDEFMRPAALDPDGTDLVFTGPRGGPVCDTSWDTAWRTARTLAGVGPVKLHDLRHQAATTLARHGRREVKVIQQHLGDSTPRAAMMYLHATDESLREVGDVFSEQFAAFADDTLVALPGQAATQ